VSGSERLPPALLAPRWWPTWALVGLLAAAGRLPWRIRLALGCTLGRALRRLMGRRRHIAHANLAYCFPARGSRWREALVARHFDELGIAVLEAAAAWSGRGEALDARSRLRGLEHVQAALARGRGAMLVAAHLTCIETSMQMLVRRVPGNAIYRRNKNPVLERVILAGRRRHGGRMFDREDMRTLLGALRANEVVWFSPDQDHGLAQGAFVEFFGRPAATVTTTARVAARTGAAVLPVLYRRLPGCRGYEIELLPALDGFPGPDPIAATRRLNRIFEQQVLLAPEQYLWVHRRFKTRPPGAAPVYGG